tara:strand:- start:161 stop:481 length:321 start_codon:yes stop_codon:yes gene_type:complete
LDRKLCINIIMSYKFRAIYTKPSDEVSLHTPPAGLYDLVNTMFDEGKITQKPIRTTDGLNETFEIVFANEAAYNEWKGNVVVQENAAARSENCTANSISFSIEGPI